MKVNRHKAQGIYQSAPEQQAVHRRIDELRQRCVPVSLIAMSLYVSKSTVRRHLACECNCLNGRAKTEASATKGE